MSFRLVQLKQAFLLILSLLLSLPGITGPFQVGSKSLSIIVGSGQAFNDDYTIIGAGFGYYVVDGLQLSIAAEAWTGGKPSINKVSPGVQYVFARSEAIKPYLGAFFTRSTIDGFDDIDSVGVRAGAVFSNHSGYYVSAGLVYESYLDCNKTTFVECDDTYPELNIIFLL